MVKKALRFTGRFARPPSRRNLVSLAQLWLFLAVALVILAFAGFRWLQNNAKDSIYDLIESNSEYDRDRISFGQPELRWKGLTPGLRLPHLRIDEHEFGDLSIFIALWRLPTDPDKALEKIELEDFFGEILFDQTGALNFKGLRLQPNLGLGNMHQSAQPWLAPNLLELDQSIELKELRLIDPYNNFTTTLSDGLFRYTADDAHLQAQAKLITDWGAEAGFEMDLTKKQTGLQGHFSVEVSTLDLERIPTPFLSAFKVRPSGTLDKARFQVALDNSGNARADLDFPDSSKIFLRHQETGYSSSLEVAAINFDVTRQKGGFLLSSEVRLAADKNSSISPRINGEFFFLAEAAAGGPALSAEEALNGGDSEPLQQLGMGLLLPEIEHLQPGPAKISGQDISLPAMQQLSRTLLPALEQRLRGLGGISLQEGQLKRWQLLFDERTDPNWSFNGSIERMSAAIGGAHPGSIEDISAQLRIEPNRARVFVSAEAVKIDFPTVFDRPLPAIATSGLIDLAINATSFKVQIPFWGLYSLGASADISGEVNFNPELGPVVDLEGEFAVPQLVILESFYPYRAVPEGLSDWLRGAKMRGRADNGTLLLRGPMRSFPFERGAGELRIEAASGGGAPSQPFERSAGELRIEADVDLEQIRYSAGWPLLRGASGKVSIGDGGFEMALPRGFAYIAEAPDSSSDGAGKGARVKTQLSDILVDIDKIHGPINLLRASVTAAGDASELLDFARQGPLAKQLGPFVQDAVGSGPVEAMIEELEVALHDTDRLELKGHLNFAGARVDSKKLLLEIDDINGRVDFTRNSYKAKNLTMRIFGGDFRVEALSDDEAQKRGQTRLKVMAEGSVEPAKVLKNYHIPGWQRLSGESGWSAVFDIHKKPQDASPRVRLTATSNLKGLKVNLPKPLAKAVFRGVPFRLDMLLDNAGEDRSLEAQYGDLLSLRIVHDTNDFNINRGHARFGPATSSRLRLPRRRVFHITGSMEEFDADGWLDFLDEVAALPSPPVEPPKVPTRMNTWPYSVEDLKAEKIEYLGFKWRGLKADVETQGNYYRSEFSAEQAGGSVDFPRDAKLGLPVFARLNYLDFDDLQPIKEESEPPDEVPPLDVKIDELVFQGSFIENLDVNLVPVSGGMVTRRLSFSNKGLKATGQGSWRQASKRGGGLTHDSSKISLDLELKDLGRAWYGMTGDGDVFEGGEGRSLIQLSWDDHLFAPEFSEVIGSINVNAESGRLLFINPVAAKVLNLLLVTQWFKGLDGGAGLLFSKLEANMVLRDSSLHQQRTQVSTDLAFIDIQGKANVTDETFELKALVSPPIAAALPATGLLLGGVPGLLGGFLLQGLSKLFSDDGDRSGLIYDVTGTWDDPEFVLSGSSGDGRP